MVHSTSDKNVVVSDILKCSKFIINTSDKNVAPACGGLAPGFLKLFLCGRLCVCLCVRP